MSAESTDSPEPLGEARFRSTMGWVVGVGVLAFSAAAFALVLWRGWQDKAWLKVAQDHFAAVVGLPLIAIAAMFVVLVLRMASGPIEVEAGSLKFKGAAAPIVFWILCFLAMSAALRMLWAPG
jgi:hypothetical protein